MTFGGRGRSNILPSNVESVAGDHDFYIVNFTPSVRLHVYVKPDKGQDMISYYRGKSPAFLIIRYFIDVATRYLTAYLFPGKAHVLLKDAIFQPLGPIHHATELLTLRKNARPNGVEMIYTNGGPDHNINFLNVQIARLAYFILSRFDTLIVGRTTPTQSWTNPGDRVMSVLNLEMHNYTLGRELMDEDFERHMPRCSIMSSVRKLAEKVDTLSPEHQQQQQQQQQHHQQHQ